MRLQAQVVVPVHELSRPYLRAVDSVLRTPEAGVVLVAHGLRAAQLNLPDDPRIKIVEVPDGVGFPGVAFNAGVQAATAPLVGILGSDDWYEDGAIASMIRRLNNDQADGVIAPLRNDYESAAQVIPPTWRSKNLKASSDGLFYRTAPLGLFRRIILQSPRYAFDESTPSGEDLRTSTRLWTDGLSVSHHPTDPAYVVGSDARSRVTHSKGPLESKVPAWRAIWDGNVLDSLSPREREDLAQKVFQVGVIPILQEKGGGDWSASDADWLVDLTRAMRRCAPGFDKGFPISWGQALRRLEAGDADGAAKALREASYLENRMPATVTEILHRNSWLRKQIRGHMARNSGARIWRRLKVAIRKGLPWLPQRLVTTITQGDAWTRDDEAQVARLDSSKPQRLLIGGVNTAGQGQRWAHSARLLPGVASVSLGLQRDNGPRFPVDAAPSLAAGWHSPVWSERQWKEVSTNATHVLVESGQPMLGALFARDPRRELIAMQREGIKVGVILHGSDVRVPSVHRGLHSDSPFSESLSGLTDQLELSTSSLNRFLDASGVSEFISTPDLLDYRPDAIWLPTLHDSELWDEKRLLGEAKKRGLTRPDGPPVVVHIPSNSALKGSDAIGAAMTELANEGVIEYRELRELTPEEVALQVAAADILIDQLTMGLYGVASVEAMSLGKPVVAQVGERVRGRIQDLMGEELPIVEATPSTIREVVKGLATDATQREVLGMRGKGYVERVHSPQMVARVLSENFLEAAE